SPGEKPAGAFDGRGFVVTQAMTSLTGSAGEDFASILRALGYRMDRRPPLPPKPVQVTETVAAETAIVEAAATAPVAEQAGPDAAVTTEEVAAEETVAKDRSVEETASAKQASGTETATEAAPVSSA